LTLLWCPGDTQDQFSRELQLGQLIHAPENRVNSVVLPRVVSRARDINTDYSRIRAMNPDLGPSSSPDEDIIIALGSNQATHNSLFLTTFVSSDMPLSTGHEPVSVSVTLKSDCQIGELIILMKIYSEKEQVEQVVFNRIMDKENVVHIHNGVLHSREKQDIMKFAGKWMELENVILSKKLSDIDGLGEDSLSHDPILEMKEQEKKEQEQGASWVQDPLPLQLCLRKWRGQTTSGEIGTPTNPFNLRPRICLAYRMPLDYSKSSEPEKQVIGNKPVQPVMDIARDQEQEGKNLDITFNTGKIVNGLIRKGSAE
ncbi:hypothetical protein STEG23_032261, partial [Scotinomys teguina]